jgi:hypothetical protein
MCDKCVALDRKIDHYEQMLISIGDRVTVERLKALIADYRRKRWPFIQRLSKSSRATSVGGLCQIHRTLRVGPLRLDGEAKSSKGDVQR